MKTVQLVVQRVPVPLSSSPPDPLLQRCSSAACSSSPLSAASAGAVAGA